MTQFPVVGISVLVTCSLMTWGLPPHLAPLSAFTFYSAPVEPLPGPVPVKTSVEWACLWCGQWTCSCYCGCRDSWTQWLVTLFKSFKPTGLCLWPLPWLHPGFIHTALPSQKLIILALRRLRCEICFLSANPSSPVRLTPSHSRKLLLLAVLIVWLVTQICVSLAFPYHCLSLAVFIVNGCLATFLLAFGPCTA